jgi:hypothetical protein
MERDPNVVTELAVLRQRKAELENRLQELQVGGDEMVRGRRWNSWEEEVENWEEEVGKLGEGGGKVGRRRWES